MKIKKDQVKEGILKELYKIRHPSIEFDELSYQMMVNKIQNQTDLPSKKTNIDIPSKKAFFDLTTSRNRQLITIDEQNILRNTVVAFFGLSVGSHAALTWMMESRADAIKIIDPDTISASNLNRLRYGWDDLGKYKVDTVADQILAINPFAKIFSSTKTDPESIKNFFKKEPIPAIIVDEIDDFESKVLLRKLAKEGKIPLISAADVGDNIHIDIERYDTDREVQPFLGRVPNVNKITFSKLSDLEKKKLIIKLVGFEDNSSRMLESLMSIGGSIVTWPQLGATATISGGAIATIIKKIKLGESVKSGRYIISLDNIFNSESGSSQNKKKIDEKINKIRRILKI